MFPLHTKVTGMCYVAVISLSNLVFLIETREVKLTRYAWSCIYHVTE